jgi:hypothetical protein
LTASNATSTRTAPSESRRERTDSSSSTDERFRLDGPSRPVDGRIQAWRLDLADIALAGCVFAPHYARPLLRACGSQASFVRPSPSPGADPVSELLPGESFAVLEYAGGWAWGYCAADHVVGYVEAIALAEPMEPTHIVCEKHAPVAADARVTSFVIATLPMGSLLHGKECGACLNTEYGCVTLSHLRRIGETEDDPVLPAERLLSAPYREGGRTAAGIDAAGLVQLALRLCGVPAPGLLDQLASLGAPVAEGAPCRRGDLILFEGGAGLMVDDLMMIHASAAAGKVTVEALAPLAACITARRRLPI